MTTINIITSEHVIRTNQRVLDLEKQQSHCLDINKVESALHSAFYPGTYPFQHGGIAQIAGALCYYIIKAHAFLDGNKRTAAVTSTVFMRNNNMRILYPIDIKNDVNALSDIIEKCATSEVSKLELMNWFDMHKHQRCQDIVMS